MAKSRKYHKFKYADKIGCIYNSTDFYVRNLILSEDIKVRTRKLARDYSMIANRTAGLITHIDVTKYTTIEYDLLGNITNKNVVESVGSRVLYEIDLHSHNNTLNK